MAKTPCLDCIDKYEKTKQRKRNAKKRQKQKEQQAAPQQVLPRSPYSGFTSAPPKTNNLADLLAVLRVSETMKQQQNTPTLNSLERTPKPPPATPKPASTPLTIPAPKPPPKTANEAVSQVVDNYVGLLTSGVPSSVLSQTPAALAAPAIVAGQYAGGLLSTPFQFLGNAASTITRPIGNAISSVYYSGNPDPEIRREAAASAAENRASLQRIAPAVGGTTPELQFIGATGRVLESSPVEQGGNPLPSVFTASAPPVNLLADLQARERAERLRPRTRIIPEDEVGGEGGSRLIEQQRRIANPIRLYEGTVPANRVAAPIGQPPLLIPEGETVNALGGGYAPLRREEVERTVLDLALRPRVDFPLVPVSAGLIPETESLAPVEEQMTPEEEAEFEDAIAGEFEEPLLEVPPTFETAASLVTGEALEEAPLTAAGLAASPRALERQTTEELAAAIEDIDIEDELAKTSKQNAIDAEKRRKREAAKLQKKLDREAQQSEAEAKRAEKLETFITNPREAAQYERLLGAAAEVQPSQLALVEGPSSVASSPLLIGAGLGFPPRSAEFTTYDVSPLTSQEEYEPITFTQPAARTFRPFEGGGI